jgi:hypothetical protein
MDRNEMSNLYRGPSIDASYQVSDQLALHFQRRRLKCEKLTDDGCQKLTLPLARWAKNVDGGQPAAKLNFSLSKICCHKQIEIMSISVQNNTNEWISLSVERLYPVWEWNIYFHYSTIESLSFFLSVIRQQTRFPSMTVCLLAIICKIIHQTGCQNEDTTCFNR